jgi:cell wall-associated NlpC family hydrolase
MGDVHWYRELMVQVAMSYLGTPYRWGGDDPSGFDCSGLAIECLKSVGLLPRGGDWTAEGLAEKFANARQDYSRPEKLGELVFWQSHNSGKIIHVEICLTRGLSIGASGGGSSTLTEADAMKQNAFIKIRPIESRRGVWGRVDPFVNVKQGV